MRIIFVVAALFLLSGCETYSVGGAIPADNVRVHVGVTTGYYDHYYYRPRPVVIHRHVHRPVVVHRHVHRDRHHHRRHHRHDRRHDRRDHRRDRRDRRHHHK